MIKPAVLKDQYLYWIAENQRRIVTCELSAVPCDIVALWWIGQKYGISHFWIFPDSEYDRLEEKVLQFSGDNTSLYDIFASYEDKDAKKGIKFSRIWKKEDSGHTVHVGYPHRGRWKWLIREPLDILSTLDYLERELCADVEWSTTHVGIDLLDKSVARKNWLAECETLRTIPYNHVARDLMFFKPLNSSHVGMYGHLIDKNGAHGSAMQDLACGEGSPDHVFFNKNMFVMEKHTLREAGIYRIAECDYSHSRWNGVDLPKFVNQPWLTTEMLNFCVENDIRVKISDGWIFEESHHTLRKWARQLWDARVSLMDEIKYPYVVGRANARSTCKAIMLTTAGSLASPFESAFHRPDWNAGFVGRARVVQCYNILSHEQQTGLLPYLIYSDGMLYIHESENTSDALPNILNRSTSLGGYKHVFTVKITEDIVRYSQDLMKIPESSRPGRMLSYLRKALVI